MTDSHIARTRPQITVSLMGASARIFVAGLSESVTACADTAREAAKILVREMTAEIGRVRDLLVDAGVLGGDVEFVELDERHTVVPNAEITAAQILKSRVEFARSTLMAQVSKCKQDPSEEARHTFARHLHTLEVVLGQLGAP